MFAVFLLPFRGAGSLYEVSLFTQPCSISWWVGDLHRMTTMAEGVQEK